MKEVFVPSGCMLLRKVFVLSDCIMLREVFVPSDCVMLREVFVPSDCIMLREVFVLSDCIMLREVFVLSGFMAVLRKVFVLSGFMVVLREVFVLSSCMMLRKVFCTEQLHGVEGGICTEWLHDVAVLMLLVFMLVKFRGRDTDNDKYILEVDPEDDIRENVINYDEEGAGEPLSYLPWQNWCHFFLQSGRNGMIHCLPFPSKMCLMACLFHQKCVSWPVFSIKNVSHGLPFPSPVFSIKNVSHGLPFPSKMCLMACLFHRKCVLLCLWCDIATQLNCATRRFMVLLHTG